MFGITIVAEFKIFPTIYFTLNLVNIRSVNLNVKNTLLLFEKVTKFLVFFYEDSSDFAEFAKIECEEFDESKVREEFQFVRD